MADKLFCPNCGHEISATDDFCPNCGFDVQKYLASQNNEANNQKPAQKPENNASNNNNNASNFQSNQRATQKPVSQPTQNKRVNNQTGATRSQQAKPGKKWPWIVGGIVAVLLIGGYMYGSNYYQPQNQLSRATKAIRDNSGDASQYFATTDPNLKINKESVAPFITYAKQNQSDFNTVISDLSSKGTSANESLKWVNTGKAFLLFDRYQIQVKSLYPAVYTTLKNSKVYVNDKLQFTTTGNSDSKKIGPLVPGEYNFKVENKLHGKNVSVKKQSAILTDQSMNLEIQTIDFKVDGMPGATVYLGGEKEGKIGSSGTKSFDDIPLMGKDNTVYMTYPAKNGTLTSHKENLSSDDSGRTVYLSFPGVISKQNAETLIEDMWDGAEEVAFEGSDDANFEDLSDLFVGGSSSSYYTDLIKAMDGYHDDDTINSVTISTHVTGVTPLKQGEYQVNYDLRYKFDNARAEGSDEDPGAHEQAYHAEAIVDKSGSKYKIKSYKLDDKYIDKHVND